MEVVNNPISSLSQLPLIRSRKHQRRTSFLSQQEKLRVVPRPLVGSHTRFRAQPQEMAILAAESSRDISVLLPVSALLIFVYWIANFVVPDLIMKDLQKDETPDNEGSQQ